MKKRSTFNGFFTLLVWFLTMFFSVSSAVTALPVLSIDIILSSNAAEYRAVFNSMKEHLELTENSRVKVSNYIVDNYVKKTDNPNLIITIGTIAAKNIAKIEAETPILSVFLPKNNYEIIWQGSKKIVSGIVIDQPIERFHELLKIILKDEGKVGIFLSNRFVGYEQIHRLLKHSPLSLTIEKVTGLITAKNITKLLNGSDIILIFPDHKTISPQRAKWLLYMAYRENKPVIGYSSSFVKAGAIAAIYSTPESIGLQLAQRIILLSESSISLKKSVLLLDSFYYPKYFIVETNAQVARHLGIELLHNKDLKHKISSIIRTHEKDEDHADF